MKVPQTPLHTSRVLKEEKDAWEDVKVRHSGSFYMLLEDSCVCMVAKGNQKLTLTASVYKEFPPIICHAVCL